MKGKIAFAALASLLVLATAGCGGKKSSATGSASTATVTTTQATTTQSAATTTAATTTNSTTTTSGSTGSSGVPKFANKNCRQLAAMGQKFAAALGSSGDSAKTLANYPKALAAMAQFAPSAIKGDFQTLAGAFGTYISALEKAGFTPGKTPTAAQLAALEGAIKPLQDPKVAAAEKDLSTWAAKNCGATSG